MFIPKSVCLGARVIPVNIVEGLVDENGLELDGVWREYEGECGTISICAKLKPVLQVETFLHELIHAIADVSGMTISEANTQTLAAFLFQAFGSSQLR